MNRTIAGLFIILLVASNIRAQGAVRRRLGLPIGDIHGQNPSLDSSDPFHTFSSVPESNAAPAGGNPIPVSQLRIPSKAVKEFERARKAFQSGDIRTSADHLQKAVQIYPDFIDAHNALGLRFIQIGEYQKALAELEIALSLNPRSAQTHQDLSLAFLLLNRYHEAEDQARQALDFDPQPPAPRYFLARALIGQGRVTPEAIQMLRQSENAFPNASLVLAQIHFVAGQTDQVITDLQHYLRKPEDPDNGLKAECWVAQLSQQSAPSGCPAQNTRPSFR
jgi:tetratricopeptide (TPR) repeat protein